MKPFAFILTILGLSTALFAQISLKDASGWLESAYVEWTAEGADSFNVYYSRDGLKNVKVDAELIRKYGSKYRADILGLVAGEYTVKVSSVKNGAESSSVETEPLKVLAQDRAGFAFAGGRVPGAYKKDGSLKDGAVVLYVSESTKNKVSLDVITDSKGSTTPCVGLQNILYSYKKGLDTRPLVIRLLGNVTDPEVLDGGDIVIENKQNASAYVTFEGVGNDATANGWGIRLKNASNVEIRNIGVMNVNSTEGDDVGLQQDNDHIWVHNMDFFYGDAGTDADQVKGDGALDCKKSTYVTFSYNHFWDNGKSNLLGLKEGTTEGLFITYHHNWYDHSDSRHPRVRFYSAHVYNNYYDGNAKYGAGSTLGSSVFMEGNYFRNCKYPMLTSLQGSDLYAGGAKRESKNGTFSSEAGGTIKAFDNYMEGEYTFIPYGSSSYKVKGVETTAESQGINTSADFDAYVVTDRKAKVPNSVKSYDGGNTYNNFDTDESVMYSYAVDSPENARKNVVLYAGRCQGGDFKWKFDNSVDDASYAVNQKLKDALVAYKGGTGEVAAYDLDFLKESPDPEASVADTSALVADTSAKDSSGQDSVVQDTLAKDSTVDDLSSADSLDSGLNVKPDSTLLVKNDSLVEAGKDSLGDSAGTSLKNKHFDVPTDVHFRLWVWESRLQVEAAYVQQITIADARGRFVTAGQMEKTSVGTSFDLSGLRQGVYTVVVKTSHGIYRRIIVVK